MRTFNKTPLALGVAAGMAMLVASTGALAISTGTDFNLSAHAKAGGMAGAAYTKPQEISASIAGNPATLTQFPGVNFNFGAALLMLSDVEYETEIVGFNSNKSTSDADNYILPTLGLGLQVSPNLFLGLGLEVDAGLGADYRDDGINLLPGTGLDTQIGLLVEVISFNANLGAAYKVTEDLSLGATVTIGFGLAQLGTAGDTSGLDTLSTTLGTNPILSDFGGTTSSVHDIAFGLTLGATYQLTDTIMTSATIKSPVEYKFQNIIYQDPVALASLGVTGDGFQNLDVSQPLEIILGAAYEEGNFLIEADVIWKEWSNADAYEDAFKDQFLIAIGSQYTAGDFQYRLGYSYATDLLKDTPSNTLGNLTGLGTIPLGDAANAGGVLGPLATDIISIVQMSLLPVIWQHTVTAGGSYSFTDAVSVDAYVSYAFGENDSRDLPTLSAIAGGINPALGNIDANQNIGSEIMVGAGISIALP